MGRGTFEGTTWPVDTDDVQWKLRYARQHVTHDDMMFAASVMASYAHLTDPYVAEGDAAQALKRARVVTKEIRSLQDEALEDEVAKRYVILHEEGPIGPFTWEEARSYAKERDWEFPIERLRDV